MAYSLTTWSCRWWIISFLLFSSASNCSLSRTSVSRSNCIASRSHCKRSHSRFKLSRSSRKSSRSCYKDIVSQLITMVCTIIWNDFRSQMQVKTSFIMALRLPDSRQKWNDIYIWHNFARRPQAVSLKTVSLTVLAKVQGINVDTLTFD